MSATRTENLAWSVAFGRQALSDLDVRDVIEANRMPRCHSLHYLQTAAEKVCKAHLHRMGTNAREKHAVVAKYIGSVAKEIGSDLSLSGARLKMLKKLGREIDLLAPALRSDGSRPDDAEYPWKSVTQEVTAPVDYDFPYIEERQIPTLVKLLRAAIEEYNL